MRNVLKIVQKEYKNSFFRLLCFYCIHSIILNRKTNINCAKKYLFYVKKIK